MKRTVYETQDKTFRILEVVDECTRYEDLVGDCFNPAVNHDIDAEVLKRDEARFKRRWLDEGTFGYVLERWNPAPGAGYEHVDSCYGFVGSYQEGAEGYDHYIVAELKSQIERQS